MLAGVTVKDKFARVLAESNPGGHTPARADAQIVVAQAPPDPASERADGWQSLLTGLGYSGRDKRTSVEFGRACSVTAADGEEMWRGDDICARVVETVPDEMLRQGFEVCIQTDDEQYAKTKPLAKKPGEKLPPGEGEEPNELEPDPEDEEYETDDERTDRALAWRFDAEQNTKELQELVSSKWEELKFEEALHRALCYERAYGGGAIYLGVQDGSSPEKPLNIKTVRSFDFLTVLEPRELNAVGWYGNPLAPKYGEVAIWQFNPSSPGVDVSKKGVPGTIEIHESRLIVFGGIRVTRRPVAGQIAGWGDSVFVKMLPVLRDFSASWASSSVLLQDFAQAVFKMKGLAEMIAQDKNKEIQNRIKAAEMSRSVLRALLIDGENEEFERKQTPIAGLPDMLDRWCNRLAAAVDMPVTLLMRTSPAGLNATGDADVRFFYDRIKAQQPKKLTSPIEYVTKIIFKVLGKPEPKKWSVEFHPLWQPTGKEMAEERKLVAETDQIYVAMKAVMPEEVAVSRFGGDKYSTEMKVDFSARAVAEREEAREEAAIAEAAAKFKAEQPPGAPGAKGGKPPFGKPPDPGKKPAAPPFGKAKTPPEPEPEE